MQEQINGVSKSISDAHDNIAKYLMDNFDMISKRYENKLSLNQHLTKTVETNISMLQAKGQLQSTRYYKNLSNIEKKNIATMKKELSSLKKAQKAALASGEIKEGSDDWYAMQQEINKVQESIDSANVSLAEYAKTIREIKWSYFAYAEEQISNIAKEAEFLINVLENSELFNDNGSFTDNGLATLGLRAENYNIYLAQSKDYARQIQKINEDIANDPYNTDLIKQRQSWIELQQESILNAEKEKQAIKSLVQDGINKELESFKELIDARKESLNNEKSLYEYNKKVKDQSKEIASIQKQIAAYSNDSSAETKAKVQKLQVNLESAQEELMETEYDKLISDTEKLLDNLYTEYEEILNSRLDNIDALISEMIHTVNLNSSDIAETIRGAASAIGYALSSETSDIWSNGNVKRGTVSAVKGVHSTVSDMVENSNSQKGYAKGGIVDYTGLAVVHGSYNRPESFLDSDDTRNIGELKEILKAKSSTNALSFGEGLNIGSVLHDLVNVYDMVKHNSENGKVSNITVGDINISIDHVEDYNDFVRQLQKDEKFEKLVQSMTVNRLSGGSSLTKHKYQW